MQLLQNLFEWAMANWEILGWIGVGTTAVSILGVLLIPFVIIRLPADYFVREVKCGSPAVIRLLKSSLRNLMGLLLVVAGVMMLVIPGQGVLTLLVGLSIMDFPGKRKAVLWVLTRKSVSSGLTWLRAKKMKPPFLLSISEGK